MFADHFNKDQITVYGRRNWERLVSLATKDTTDTHARKVMADALAALVCEVTPMHREVLSSQYLTGARGRMHTHPLPPGLPEGDPAAHARWAALVYLDCVDAACDLLAADHSITERLAWRAAAERYTGGAERYGRS